MPDRRPVPAARPRPQYRGQPGCVRFLARPPSPAVFLLEATRERERHADAALAVSAREPSAAHRLIAKVGHGIGPLLLAGFSQIDSRCCPTGRATPILEFERLAECNSGRLYRTSLSQCCR